MKHRIVVEIVTESVEEEQFILHKFMEAWWVPTQRRGHTTFYLPADRESDVQEALNEYKERSKK